jgi:hypothetical protein
MAWYLKLYECSACGTKWTDEWSCTCNDRCPKCRAEIEPYDDVDLTYIVAPCAKGTFSVLFSPDTAESAPDYELVETFLNEEAALARVRELHELLEQGETPHASRRDDIPFRPQGSDRNR